MVLALTAMLMKHSCICQQSQMVDTSSIDTGGFSYLKFILLNSDMTEILLLGLQAASSKLSDYVLTMDNLLVTLYVQQ